MPFTFSHPAAVIPFAGRGLVFSALVIGSMSPDFEYFMSIPQHLRIGHTLPGVFLFCIPTGLALLWLFHAALKAPLLSLMPVSHQEKLHPLASGFRFCPLRRLLLVCVSIAIGAITHVVWDSFTHEHGWMVQQAVILNTSLIQTTHGELRLYKVLQHGSTVGGGIIVATCYFRWLKIAPKSDPFPVRWTPRSKAILVSTMVGFACACALTFAFWNSSPVTDFASFRSLVGRMVVAGITTAFIEVVAFAIWWHAFPRTVSNNLHSS